MKLQASRPINMEVPLPIFQASLYTGKASLEFLSINKKNTRIELSLPFSKDSTKKALFQQINGKFLLNSKGIDWKNSYIKRVVQFDIYSDPGKSKKEWEASKFKLTGRNIGKIASAYKSWYSTPDDYDKYASALKKTQKLVEKFLLGKDDIIIGSNFNDILIAGDGKDSITGRQGADIMSGGKGPDTFIYNSIKDSWIMKKTIPTIDFSRVDTITDFDGAKGDKINLKNKSFGKLSYIGDSSFSGKGGEVRFDRGSLQVDTSNSKFLMNVFLSNVTTFSADYLDLMA